MVLSMYKGLNFQTGMIQQQYITACIWDGVEEYQISNEDGFEKEKYTSYLQPKKQDTEIGYNLIESTSGIC